MFDFRESTRPVRMPPHSPIPVCVSAADHQLVVTIFPHFGMRVCPLRTWPALGAIGPTDRDAMMLRPCFRMRCFVLLAVSLATLTGCARLRNLLADPVEESRSLTQRAKDAADARNYDSARDFLARASRLTPDDPEVHRQQARVLIQLGNRRAAIGALQRAVAKDQADVPSRVQLAQMLYEDGRPDDAAAPLREALELDPAHTDGLLLRAKLAEQTGKSELAMETYHRVLGCDGEQAEAKLQLARLQTTAGRSERAAPLLRSICECPRSTPAQRAEAHWSLGMIYGREQRWSDAAGELTAAAEIRKELPAEDWYRVAYARYRADDHEGAMRAMSGCLRQNSQHDGALVMSATLQALGSTETAAAPRSIIPAQFAVSSLPAPEGW